MVYFTLFAVSFISATLFPLGSEALLLYDITLDNNIVVLWSVATLGNSLGSLVNYYLGLKGEVFLEERVNLSQTKLLKAKLFFDRYGSMSLLFSWLPFIGDSLTFIAGLLHFNLKKFILLIFIAKGGRYLIMILVAQGLFESIFSV